MAMMAWVEAKGVMPVLGARTAARLDVTSSPVLVKLTPSVATATANWFVRALP
jgi:hypothetical protein